MEIRFASNGSLTPVCREKMKEAVSRVFGDEPVRMVRSEPGPGVVGFGIDSGIRTLGPREIEEYPTAVGFLTHAFSRLKPVVPLVPWDCDPSKILYLDIETHNAGKQFSMPAREFFRLGQYAWGPTGEVIVTTDYDEVIQAIRLAEGVIAHNGHNFDFSVLFGADSTEALQMAMDGKLFDTMVFAALACPAPDVYVNRAGVTQYVKKPEMALKWLSLDNLCYQLGTDGKEGNLKELAARHNPKGTRVSDLDYGLIPLDDPDFLAYAVQDVKSLQELTNALLTLATPSDYDWREQLNAAIDAQNTRNGLRVDVPKAKARVEELRVRREALMADLESRYGFPTEGKMPWRTNPGKEAILKALADVGVTPETHPDWPKTKTGNISLGGEALVDLTSGTQAAELGQALAELMGQRSLAQLALDSVHPDGKAHPDISALQRSGRKSTTRPGLTVWSSHDETDEHGNIVNEKSIEKAYFIPNADDELLVEMDYSNADQRIIAAYSGDTGYAQRFDEGVDGHEINGRIMFGDKVYDSNPKFYRNEAKAPGHAYTYGAGAGKLAGTTGLPYETMLRFCRGMEETYPDVAAWQKQVRTEGESGAVLNDWGRKMVLDPEKAWTVAPALYGQSGTREIVVDALIRMLRFDMRIIQFLVIQVHDALVFSIPEKDVEWAVPKIKELMECWWGPSDGTGQVIHFPVGVGQPGKTWQLASHV